MKVELEVSLPSLRLRVEAEGEDARALLSAILGRLRGEDLARALLPLVKRGEG